MKQKELDEILDCLGDERRVFYYLKDRYCLDMINWYMENNKRQSLQVRELNKPPLQRFSTKPIVKNITKRCGNGMLTKDDVSLYWNEGTLAFTLTLDRWGEGDRDYDQTSRNQQNLVLQINFDNKHNQEYHRLLKPSDNYGPFEFRGHPIRRGYRKTLSWVRIDADLSTGEALIEEVQNDWLRDVNRDLEHVNKHLSKENTAKPGDVINGIHCEYGDIKEYAEVILKPYKTLWAELSLAAAIRFIRNELGISIIYYHTFDTGRKIKKIYDLPPKSMYTSLPKQFGFEVTNESPMFLQRDKQSKRYLQAIKTPQWYCINV
ncbi:hypothetical protein AB835_05810 [Candidatus Endobugula sertula]|uniref:Uncharacterized protein n=1 Tax=Candidatus Endobugula sertula TaxID=62101 RepID=A0A1D2QR26_9GAMM|nr:hypothetical protein AB835_05810 [Candidatus Endobugula sertula]